MRIGIIGSGSSGLTIARLLCQEHDIVVFEADKVIGGHARTVDVFHEGRNIPIDVGFITFDAGAYPRFSELVQRLGVPTQRKYFETRLHEYSSDLMWEMNFQNPLVFPWNDILAGKRIKWMKFALRLFRDGRAYLKKRGQPGPWDQPMGDYLRDRGYPADFVNAFVLPVAVASWTVEDYEALRFPMFVFFEFIGSTGVFGGFRRPDWQVFPGGSRVYVNALAAPFRQSIRLGTEVSSVSRIPDGVRVEIRGAPSETFDEVVFAVRGELALRMLGDPTPLEKEILGKFRSGIHHVVLHDQTDSLPFDSLGWNIRVRAGNQRRAQAGMALRCLKPGAL